MKYVVCSIRDRSAAVYAQPFFQISVSSAIRAFSDAVNSVDGGLMNTHAEDFDLFHLGFYDDHHARFELLESPVQIAIGKEVRRPTRPLAAE